MNSLRAVFMLVQVMVSASADAQPPMLTLPAPSGEPQAIDFARDPLLVFTHKTGPEQPFLEAVGQATEAHPSVAAAISEQEALQAIRTQVRAGLFPQVNTQFVTSKSLARNFPGRSALVESLQPRSRSDVVVAGDQLLFDFGATGNRIRAADDRVEAARIEVEGIAADAALRAISAWYDVLVYQTLGELSAALTSRQRQILADVQARAAQGVGPQGDIARTQAVLADTEADSSRFERQLGRARSRYQEAFGQAPTARLYRPKPAQSRALSLDEAQALARQSPGVKSALLRAEAARRDWRAAKADGLPRLSAGINGSRYGVFSGEDYDVRGTIVLRQLLFAGGRQRGVVAEAAARQRGAAAVADRVTGESEREAGIAFTDSVALARIATSLEAAYIANRRARDTYVEQFRVSRGSLIELLRSERDYFNAATGLLQAVVEADVARYALLARTGELLPVVGVTTTASSGLPR